MVLLKSAALKEGTKLFLKAFRIQKTKLKKWTFFRKLKTLLMMKSVSELLPSTGAPVFASRKQVAIECWQNPVPERKDVRYMFYFLSWDRIERLLNLICCWDYIQSSLTNTATIFLSLLHQNESNLPPGRSPSVMLFTLRTLVCMKSLGVLTHPRAGLRLAVDRSRYRSKENCRKWSFSLGLTLWWAGGEVVGLIKSWLSMRFP